MLLIMAVGFSNVIRVNMVRVVNGVMDAKIQLTWLLKRMEERIDNPLRVVVVVVVFSNKYNLEMDI